MDSVEKIQDDLQKFHESWPSYFRKRMVEEVLLLRKLVAAQKLEMERLRDALKDCAEVLKDHSHCRRGEEFNIDFCMDCHATTWEKHKPKCGWRIAMDKAKEVLKGEGHDGNVS